MKKLLQNKLVSFVFPSESQPYWEGFILGFAWKQARLLAKHPIISGSTAIFLGAFLGNIFNFLFNLFMSRNVSDSDYGTLTSLSSLMTLFALPVGAIIPMLVYFSASYYAKGDLDLIRGLYRKVTKPAFIIGIVFLAIFSIYRIEIARFFNIQETSYIIFVGLNTFLAFVGLANQPLLQAKLAFGFLASLNTFSAFLKLTLSIIAVFFGYSVGGVLWAFLISSLIPYFVSFFPLKFLLARNTTVPSISLKSISLYGAPAALAMFGLTSLITIDIILVKHFFAPDDAGVYARLSLIGKVIYYFSAPIASVMFPLIAQKHSKGENFHNDVRLSFLLVLIPSICLLIFYSLFPSFVVSIFSPKPIPHPLVYLIIVFGIFTGIYGLLSVLTNFYLSINKTNVFIPILLGAFFQAMLIWLFHETFFQVIMISLSIAGLLLIGLLLYYWKLYGKKSK